MAKKLKQKSQKELRQQKERISQRIKEAEEKGQKKKAAALRSRRKKVTGAIARKRNVSAKQLKRAKEYTLDDIYNSPDYALLSDKQKEALKAAVDLYDPGSAPKGLTVNELELIAQEAASIVDPYYDEQLEDITQDYETNLGNELDYKKKELSRAEEDLQVALENNDTYAAEQIRSEIADLRTAIPEIEANFQEYTAFKQEFLERETTKYNQELANTLGYADEDEARNLRQMEREHKNALKQLGETMRSRGYAFSSDKLEAEEDEEAAYSDVVSATTSQYQRMRQEAQQRYDYVTAATQAETEFDLAQREAQKQQAILQDFRAAEQRLGTEQARALAEEMGINPDLLVGSIEGAIARNTRLSQEEMNRALERGREDVLRSFTEQYGSGEAQRLLGSGYSIPKDVTGAAPTLLTRQQRELEYSRKAEQKGLEQIMQSQRTLGAYL